MSPDRRVPLHVRLVLANGVVFAIGVLVTTFAPAARRGVAALLALVVGTALVFAVNTRHLRRSLAPMVSALGTLTRRWENEHRAQAARSVASREFDSHRVATELHDNVGATLSKALVGLKRAVDKAPADLAPELRAVQHDLQTTFVEVRKITRSLRPELLEDMGLQSALGFLAANLAKTSPALEVQRHLEGPFPGIGDDAELVIYRVAEEALANVGRHAKAKTVELGLQRRGERVVLRVCDDGVGLGRNGERTGILSMRERAALVGGRLDVAARPGGGTEVLLDVPVHPDAGR